MTYFRRRKLCNVMKMTSYVTFEVLLCHSQILRPLIGQITQLLIIEAQKRPKLSDILSFFLTLTLLREGLQPPPWLHPWFKSKKFVKFRYINISLKVMTNPRNYIITKTLHKLTVTK